MSRVAILGGTRFVGDGIVRRLLAQGHELTLFNRGQTPDDFGTRVRRRRIDRSRMGSLAQAVAGETFDAVVDTTAYTGVDSAEAVAAFAGRCGRFVHISTGQVYLVRRDYRAPAREEDDGPPFLDDPGPRAADDQAEWRYGMGKWACEQVLMQAASDDRFPAIRLRLPVIHGARDHTGRLRSYADQLRSGSLLRLPDGGRNVVRHIDVDDVAWVVEQLIGEAGAPLVGQALNAAWDETPSLAEIVTTVARVLGLPVPTMVQGQGPSPFSGRWSSVLDTDKAKRTLGFAPRPFADTIARALAEPT